MALVPATGRELNAFAYQLLSISPQFNHNQSSTYISVRTLTSGIVNTLATMVMKVACSMGFSSTP